MDSNDIYIEIDFHVSPSDDGRDILLALLAEQQFESFLETKTGLRAYIKQADWNRIDVQQALSLMPSAFVVSHQINEIPTENWNAHWEFSFQPIVVGDYTVRASFHPPKTTAYELIIEPKMSFGTGHHQTTQLMMKHALEIDMSGKNVLDMGCGTGILGILAADLGAKSVLAIDIESWCVENTQENAERNRCNHIVKAIRGDVNMVAETYDLIFANINRNTLIRHIPHYAKRLQSQGVLLLSGFYQTDLLEITQESKANGFTFQSNTQFDDWVCAKYVYSGL
jgi:ribosomal protein L11 methyltransferase